MEWVRPLIDYGKEREERVREQREHPSSPHMLHVVRRVKPLKGRPWWEKQIMEELYCFDGWTLELVIIA